MSLRLSATCAATPPGWTSARGYLRRHGVILLDGLWGTVIEQHGHVRVILHTEHGPETHWYPSQDQALDAVAAHVREACAWADQLRHCTSAGRAAEREEAIATAAAAIAGLRQPPPAPLPPSAPGTRLRRLRSYVTALLAGRRPR